MTRLERIEILKEFDEISSRLWALRQRLDGEDVAKEKMVEAAVKACNGKRHYRSIEAAGMAANSAKSKGSTDDLRAYQCPACQLYHLTKVDLLTQANYEETLTRKVA